MLQTMITKDGIKDRQIHVEDYLCEISKVKYLGYGFYRYKGKCRLKIHSKSVTEMRNRLRELTVRRNRWSNREREKKLREFIRG